MSEKDGTRSGLLVVVAAFWHTLYSLDIGAHSLFC